MQSLIICSSPADAAMARAIRHYLAVNCPMVALQEDASICSAGELLEVVERALSADIVLLLLSPDSVPSSWRREEWEAVLFAQPRELGTALAFTLARSCRFPELFRKQRFFDFSAETPAGLRKLRRWLLDQNPLGRERADRLPARAPCVPDAEGHWQAELECGVGDQPGVAHNIPREAALVFAHTHRPDFEGSFWVDCRGRGRAGIVGDLAEMLGLRLAGRLEQNSAALREFCAKRRCLFAFDQIPRDAEDLIGFGGRASVILNTRTEEQAEALPLADIAALFARWRSDPARCLPFLGDAWWHLKSLEQDGQEENAFALKRLGTSVYSLLCQRERLAEAFETAELLSARAWESGDAAELRHWESEKTWIREAWGERSPARLRLGIVAEPEQISLF